MKLSLTNSAIWLDDRLAKKPHLTIARVILELIMVARNMFQTHTVAQDATVYRYDGIVYVSASIDGVDHTYRLDTVLSDHLLIAHDPLVKKSGVLLYLENCIRYE